MLATFTHGSFDVTLVPAGQPWSERCYLVHDRTARQLIVVDPGGAADDVRMAVERAQAQVTAIVLTHAHHDHVRVASELSEDFAVKCHVHSADFGLLRKAPMYSVAFGGRPFPVVADPVALESPGSLRFASGLLRIVHTPGHTPGSSCLLLPGFALTGDTLLRGTLGRTDLPGSDPDALAASVDRLLEMAGDDDVLYAGHREPWRVREARRWWHEARGALSPSTGTTGRARL